MSLLPFDTARQQLESTCAQILKSIPEEARNAALPAVSLKRGKTSVEIAFADLPRTSVFTMIEVLAPYFRALNDLKKGYPGLSFSCDLYSDFDRRRNERERTRTLGKAEAAEPPPELPPPLDFSCRFDMKGAGLLTFEKAGDLAQEEINAIVDLVKKLAAREVKASAAADPAARLEEMGAVVFAESADFHESRIAGYESTKRDIKDSVILPLLNPQVFEQVTTMARTKGGTSVPRAVLFEGPPGTGKTTMARVIANTSKLPLVYVPIESIMSKWYGESEKRLDAIFDAAGAFPKSLVFLDEIDAFAGSREQGGMHEGTRRILSVLLRQLQGLVDTSNVVVIGATNRKADLDPALLSRFTLSIHFPLPNLEERAAIIGYYAKHLGSTERAHLGEIANGRSGRELEDACGVAERLWASDLVQQGRTDHVTAPPLASYEEAFRLKFGAK